MIRINLVGSNISAENEVNIQSGGDTTVSASNILAWDKDNSANVNINAGGNIIVSSGLDTSNTKSKQSAKGFLKSSSKNKNTYDETNVASTIAATGNVNMDAGGDAVISGSNLNAGEDIDIAANSVNIIGVDKTHTEFEKKTAKGWGIGSTGTQKNGEHGKSGYVSIYGKKSEVTDNAKILNVGSLLDAGGSISLKAGDSDINIIGSRLRTH